MVVVDDAGLTLHQGDCRAILPTLPADSVHCVVTSPPYWGLRDYGCEGQLGLEPTPEEYVATMVAVFREVRRVLRDDGTLWLNMGDAFSDKQLVGMPWRLAFALQADGWYLRADIIWAKPNPMPESVTDRPTKAHEYVFLLSKSARYFYDAAAVAEPAIYAGDLKRTNGNAGMDAGYDGHRTRDGFRRGVTVPATRNLRSVWSIPSAPFPDAHFATFPPALAQRCILAGTSEKGCCRACGAPWTRVVEHERESTPIVPATAKGHARANGTAPYRPNCRQTGGVGAVVTSCLRGWAPTCPCATTPIPCTVLDPFAGSGTTALVAEALGRRSLLIELAPPYVHMAQGRTTQRGLFTHAETTCTPTAVGTADSRLLARPLPL
jgi:DNA modification methylase